jgi:MobA/MobL family
MSAAASWYHCSVKPISRSAGRSVVAAAAYRLGERLHDERYDQMHDYTRRSGVVDSFTLAPEGAPDWVLSPEKLWNAAERAETRINSRVAREVELALPAFLSPEDRREITERFAGELVGRYGVAVTVALHSPGRGDDRNYHAHILFTTREVMPDGFGRKTRVLDDRKTGPEEVTKLRELAASIINESLAAVNSDIRVDHRSFKDRGIEKEPTKHLGPAAASMERRGEGSSRGDVNRDANHSNQTVAEDVAQLDALDTAILRERERISAPPRDRDDAQERVKDDIGPFIQAIRERGVVADLQSGDGISWWQRAALMIAQKARALTIGLFAKAVGSWRQKARDVVHQQSSDDGGRER